MFAFAHKMCSRRLIKLTFEPL